MMVWLPVLYGVISILMEVINMIPLPLVAQVMMKSDLAARNRLSIGAKDKAMTWFIFRRSLTMTGVLHQEWKSV